MAEEKEGKVDDYSLLAGKIDKPTEVMTKMDAWQ